MLKREIFEKVGTFKEYFLYVEDYEFWTRISKQYHIYSDPEPLLRYRIHATNASKQLLKTHFYEYLTLVSAFTGVSQETKEKKKELLYRLHFSYAMQALGADLFTLFQRHYITSSLYGNPSWTWRIKYWLSHYPNLFRAVKWIKQKALAL
jgi:GT2 family glycosyltransferase